MASEKNLQSIFSDIANAIREKTKTTDLIKSYDMAEKIKTITGGIPGTNYYLPDSSEKYNLDIVADEANLNRIDITSSATGDTTVNIYATEKITNVSLNGGSNGNLTGIVNIATTNYTGTIVADNLVPENIKEGIKILGVTGTFEGGIPGVDYFEHASTNKYALDIMAKDANLSVIDITPSAENDIAVNIFATETTTNLTLSGGSNGDLTGTVNIDAANYTGTVVTDNLVPENIAKGKTILGVQGTLESGGGGSGGETTLKALLDATKATSYLFQDYNGTSVDGLIKKEDTSNVTKMNGMFYYCQYLISIPELNTSNVTSMREMFSQCINLKSIPQLDTSNVISMNNMFYRCSNLTSTPTLNTSKVNDIGYMFRDCYLLNKIDITYMDPYIASNYFADNCKSLIKVIIRNMTSAPSLHSKAFNNCYHFTGTVDQTYNPQGLKDGRIYVPDNMVNNLKAATNWSAYADIIVPLSTLEE